MPMHTLAELFDAYLAETTLEHEKSETVASTPGCPQQTFIV